MRLLADLKAAYYWFAIGGVIVTAVVLSVQLLLIWRQNGVLRSQQELQAKDGRLQVITRARALWEEAALEGHIARVFEIFPRTSPSVSPAVAGAHEEWLYSAQRLQDFREVRERYGDHPDLVEVLGFATKHIEKLNDIAELIEWDLIELQPVLQKWHIALIQRTWLLEPLILARNVERESRWGMRVLRLGQLARTYNDIKPIHAGNSVRITAIPTDTGVPWRREYGYGGVIYRSGSSPFGTPTPAGRTARGPAQLPAGPPTQEAQQEQSDMLDQVGELAEQLRSSRK